MSKDAPNQPSIASPEVVEKIQELATLIAQEQFGPQGVPKDITFSVIEEIGHRAGQRVAAEVDQRLIQNHCEHFDTQQPCPQCGQLCQCKPSTRELKTRDGTMILPETACYCPTCRRSFFPFAGSAET